MLIKWFFKPSIHTRSKLRFCTRFSEKILQIGISVLSSVRISVICVTWHANSDTVKWGRDKSAISGVVSFSPLSLSYSSNLFATRTHTSWKTYFPFFVIINYRRHYRRTKKDKNVFLEISLWDVLAIFSTFLSCSRSRKDDIANCQRIFCLGADIATG